MANFLIRDPSVIVRMVEKVESKFQEENNFRQSVATLARYLSKRVLLLFKPDTYIDTYTVAAVRDYLNSEPVSVISG